MYVGHSKLLVVADSASRANLDASIKDGSRLHPYAQQPRFRQNWFYSGAQALVWPVATGELCANARFRATSKTAVDYFGAHLIFLSNQDFINPSLQSR
jgi:hypothetical protein